MKILMLDKRSENLLLYLVVRFLIFWPLLVGMSRSFFLSTFFRFLFFFFLSSLGDMYSSLFVFLCTILNVDQKHMRRKFSENQMSVHVKSHFASLGQ